MTHRDMIPALSMALLKSCVKVKQKKNKSVK